MQYLEIMEIKVIKIEQISDNMERWRISLPKANFREFGFLFETLEGLGLHKRIWEVKDQLELDVAVGMKDELLALLKDLTAW